MALFLQIIKIVAIVIVALFAVTFTVYFFNLDMKLTSKLEPIFLKHYDRIKRDIYI